MYKVKEKQNDELRDAEIFDYLGLGDSNDAHASRKKIIVLNIVAVFVTFLVSLFFLWDVFYQR